MNAYWISNKDRKVLYSLKGESSSHGIKCNNYIPWMNNDVISVRLDCCKWTVEFRINNKTVVKTINIKAAEYFVLIESNTNNCKYNLVY